MQNEQQAVFSLSNGLNVFFDEQKCLEEIRGHYEWCLEQLGNLLLRWMQSEVIKTVDGNGPGKPEWRENMRKKIKVISKEISDKQISVKVGISEEDMVFTDFVRAMVVAAGSGSEAGNPPIEAGPQGRIVFNDELDRQHASQVEDQYTLPEGFNQEGNEFVANAIKRMRTYAPRYVKALNRRIMESIKSNIYYTKKR